MKKTALILYGSPHNNGKTKKILINLLNYSSLKNEYNFTTINAYDENIKPCIDCKNCIITKKCIYSDYHLIDLALKNSELIIIATPVYNLSLPAPLKAIIDRSQIYYNLKTKLKINPFKNKKKLILILTSGSNNKKIKDIIIEQLKLFFVLINAKLCKVVFISNTDNSTI